MARAGNPSPAAWTLVRFIASAFHRTLGQWGPVSGLAVSSPNPQVQLVLLALKASAVTPPFDARDNDHGR